jgi:D-alanyl-lipoteichoic acid acyltransferase DltB (MBOAT superfamily)
MVFNSLEFAVFVPIVFGAYWATRGRLRSLVLLLASYAFYAFWNWRFLPLIALSSAVDYWIGIALEHRRGG